MAYNNDGTDKKGLIGVDAPRVHPDVAVELMTHHLQLAATYFEATPDNETATLTEMMRIMRLQNPTKDFISGEMAGALAWFTEISRHYAKMKAKHG